MENNNQYSEFARKVIEGVALAQQKMVREKAIRGETLVVADSNGEIITLQAQDILKKQQTEL